MEPHVVHLKKIDSNPLLLAVSFFQSRASLLFPSNVVSKLASIGVVPLLTSTKEKERRGLLLTV